jgi:hypothetical protein
MADERRRRVSAGDDSRALSPTTSVFRKMWKWFLIGINAIVAARSIGN